MAGQRLTDKTLLEKTSADDLYMAVDVSDTSSSAEGTSKRIKAQNIIQTDLVSLNLDLASNPATLISAPGYGYIIQPLVFTFIYTYNSSSSSTGGYLYGGYDETSTQEFLFRVRDFIKNDTGNRTYQLGAGTSGQADGVIEDTISNKAFKVYGMDLGGDGDLKAYATYQIFKL